MKFKNLLLFALLVFSVLFTVSCGDDEPELTDCEKTNYNENVKQIMTSSCALSGCHDGAADSDRQPLTAFTEVDGLSDGVKKRALTMKDMPPQGAIDNGKVEALTDDERAVIQCWLDNGKKEN